MGPVPIKVVWQQGKGRNESFVHFNEKANARRGDNVSRYWDWRLRVDPDVYFMYFNGTAPTHHLYGLRAALDLIKAEGMTAIWARHWAWR